MKEQIFTFVFYTNDINNPVLYGSPSELIDLLPPKFHFVKNEVFEINAIRYRVTNTSIWKTIGANVKRGMNIQCEIVK